MKTTHTDQCYVDVTLSVIGGKWKPVILWHLAQGTFRFSELSKRIPGISQKMLAQQLREMEKDQLVSRKMYPVIPPKVEYSMTEHGQSLRGVLKSLGAWGERHNQATHAS